MAGHSQFKNIMHRKGRQDSVRAKLFSKLAKEITVSAKIGGSDSSSNSRLRLAVQTAKSQSMPKENIQRAINKSQGSDSENYEEIRYEGYGPGGVAIIVEALSDNRNRTASSVRAAFTKYGGALGETGSVVFMFDRVGQIMYPLTVADSGVVLETAIEVGVEDVLSDEQGHLAICAFEDVGVVSAALEDVFGPAEDIQIIWQPRNSVPVDEDKAAKLMTLIGVLEDNDDVQNVYANFEIDDAVAARLISS